MSGTRLLIITAVLMLAAITSCSTAPEPQPDMSEFAVPPMPQPEMIPYPPASLADAPLEQREWIITVLDRYESLVKAWATWGQSVFLALLPYQVEAHLMGDNRQPEASGK